MFKMRPRCSLSEILENMLEISVRIMSMQVFQLAAQSR